MGFLGMAALRDARACTTTAAARHPSVNSMHNDNVSVAPWCDSDADDDARGYATDCECDASDGELFGTGAWDASGADIDAGDDIDAASSGGRASALAESRAASVALLTPARAPTLSVTTLCMATLKCNGSARHAALPAVRGATAAPREEGIAAQDDTCRFFALTCDTADTFADTALVNHGASGKGGRVACRYLSRSDSASSRGAPAESEEVLEGKSGAQQSTRSSRSSSRSALGHTRCRGVPTTPGVGTWYPRRQRTAGRVRSGSSPLPASMNSVDCSTMPLRLCPTTPSSQSPHFSEAAAKVGDSPAPVMARPLCGLSVDGWTAGLRLAVGTRTGPRMRGGVVLPSLAL